MFASKDIYLTAPSGYQISRSVRLRSSATAYFNRTFGASATTATFSFWIKRGTLGSIQEVFGWSNGSSAYTLEFSANDTFLFGSYTSGWIAQKQTTQVFRDPSAWYHIVCTQDTTNATATDRMRIYVNGVRVTSFTASVDPAQNTTTNLSQSTWVWGIGRQGNTATYYNDCYLAEFNLIDGQALTPSSFGQYNANGVWSPIKYAGTYGTNGFYLNFSDNSGVTATTIGKDNSGNGNNWTPNNISVTAGVTYDSMIDVPTPYADGGTGRGNYAVMNPLDSRGTNTVSNANLTYLAGAAFNLNRGTIAMTSGKWYWEVTSFTGTVGVGISKSDVAVTSAGYDSANGWAYFSDTGNKWNNNSGVAYGATFGTTDVIGVALDMDSGAITFYKNNTSQGVAFNTGLAGQSISPMLTSGSGASGGSLNFGQRPFSYTPPTGYVALNTQNLSTPTIANGAAYMAATLYTGNGTSQNVNNSVNGVSFQPDWAWFKSRNNAASHAVFDSVRGANQGLYPNLTNAEGTWSGQAFLSNGFTVNATYSGEDNTNGNTMVGWQWKAGGTAVSNTSGSITSSVSVGATQGFSVVTYTGTGANATVGHGLGVAPKMVITKNRGATSDWAVWHTSLTSGAYYLLLDTTAAQASGATYWNSTVPTSSVFSVGTATPTNVSTNTYVAYCFSEVAGFSKFGSYTGNGSADGPFVYLGFRPRWIMVKRTDSTSDWYIWDTSRDTYNVEAATLLADTSGAETSATSIDDLSNGFKCRSATVVNVSTGTYIYAAFAEVPLKYALAR